MAAFQYYEGLGLMKKAVFFDRDGVIVKPMMQENGQPRAPFCKEEFQLFPKAEETLRQVKQRGFLCILVTNQPDVAYGNISQKEWQEIQNQVSALPFDDIYICFHTRNENCKCKKPKPGMIVEAMKKWNIDPVFSYMIGDIESDIIAAKAANVTSILLKTAYNKGISSDHAIDLIEELPTLLR